jgi:hypothetical protein
MTVLVIMAWYHRIALLQEENSASKPNAKPNATLAYASTIDHFEHFTSLLMLQAAPDTETRALSRLIRGVAREVEEI